MANLIMESFQTVKNPLNIYTFRSFFEKFNYKSLLSGGRDGNKYLSFYSTEKKRSIFDFKKQCYWIVYGVQVLFWKS